MTPLDFSVLLLAWDNADPSVAVLGGSALPPTLPLVYQLAAQQPVLAVYPHLPTDEQAPGLDREAVSNAQQPSPLPGAAPEPAKDSAEAPAADALTTTASQPGVRLLPGLAASEDREELPTVPLSSRIIGLEDLPAGPHTPVGSEVPMPATYPAAPARSQWPTGVNAPLPTQWQAPAAPYLGGSSGGLLPPTLLGAAPSARASQTVREAALPAASPPATLRPNASPQAGDLRFDPDPDLPGVRLPPLFSETTEEPGPAEATALSAPEDNLAPDATAPAEAEALPRPLDAAPQLDTAALLVWKPALEGLNFRMIQYARRAAQLVRERRDFGVIYAPNWPAWLAALEIRNSTGRPLALYLAGLAADFATVAERGWLLEVERMTLRRARIILVPDEDVRRRLGEQYGAAIGEVRVVAAADEAAVQRVLSQVAHS